MVKFVLLALLSVVVIYLLIDLFQELNYFITRKVGLGVVLLYYLYSLPAAVTLLYPVSLLLAVFVVYGQMTRHREMHALESAGVRVVRMFVPTIGVGMATVLIYLAGNELVTVPANAALSDLRAGRIERRAVQVVQKRRDVYYVGESGRIFNIREFDPQGVMVGFSIQELDAERRVRRRYDGARADYFSSAEKAPTGDSALVLGASLSGKRGVWVGYDVTMREFGPDGTERLVTADTMLLAEVEEVPDDFSRTARPVEETSSRELRRHIGRMRRAGEDVADEEVEYYYRFSYSLIGLIVVLLGLPVSVRLRKGGTMLGLGLGLLISFLYWGTIQMSRAYGTSHVISPMMAAWLPNILFGALAVALIAYVRQ